MSESNFTADEYVEQIRRILINDQKRITDEAVAFGVDPIVIAPPEVEEDIVRQIAEYHVECDDHGDANPPFDASHICYLYDYLLYQSMVEENRTDHTSQVIQERIDAGQNPYADMKVAWQAEEGSSVLEDPDAIWLDKDSTSPVEREPEGPRMIDEGATELVPVLRYQIWEAGRRLAGASDVSNARELLGIAQVTKPSAYAYDVQIGHVLISPVGKWEPMKDEPFYREEK